MAMLSAVEDSVIFARDIDPEINARLQQAVACAHDFERARDLMLEAMALDPDQLAVHIALYKFYFYRGYLDEAEAIVMQALDRASQQGQFTADWRNLTVDSANWRAGDGPERVFLYSLKALSFICLRKQKRQTALDILNKLEDLDPDDQVGSSVIAALAEGA